MYSLQHLQARGADSSICKQTRQMSAKQDWLVWLVCSNQQPMGRAGEVQRCRGGVVPSHTPMDTIASPMRMRGHLRKTSSVTNDDASSRKRVQHFPKITQNSTDLERFSRDVDESDDQEAFSWEMCRRHLIALFHSWQRILENPFSIKKTFLDPFLKTLFSNEQKGLSGS